MTHLDILGMSCEHREATVKGALEAVEGVTAARIDLTRGRAVVEGSAEVAALIAAVEDEGYQASETAHGAG
ncbi:MAG: heavy-metal-associated domain-containing protein [Deinococcota bacterium]|jgi:copper chaperone|nr:heavy-metal-associated domain-containing protein [Deinococcota bacterium]